MKRSKEETFAYLRQITQMTKAARRMGFTDHREMYATLRGAGAGDPDAIELADRLYPEWRELLGTPPVADETEVVDILSITRQKIDESTLISRSKKSKPRRRGKV